MRPAMFSQLKTKFRTQNLKLSIIEEQEVRPAMFSQLKTNEPRSNTTSCVLVGSHKKNVSTPCVQREVKRHEKLSVNLFMFDSSNEILLIEIV